MLKFIKTLNKASFDLIILDPPTFSNSKRMQDVLDIQQDHVFLINDCLELLAENGELIFSTNCRNFQLATEKINTLQIKDITKLTTPFDFEGKLNRKCYLLKK